MTEDIDELGPVDWIVVEFPGSKFNGEIAPALGDLVERGIVRVLDLLLLKKDMDGSLEAYELSDLDDSEIGELRSYETELAMLLSEDDVDAVAAVIDSGSTAAVLIWENTWAAPFASATRRAGGQLVASGRIPVQALLAAIETDEEVGAWHAFSSQTFAPSSGDRTRPGRAYRHHGRHGGGGGTCSPTPHRSARRSAGRPQGPAALKTQGTGSERARIPAPQPHTERRATSVTRSMTLSEAPIEAGRSQRYTEADRHRPGGGSRGGYCRCRRSCGRGQGAEGQGDGNRGERGGNSSRHFQGP
ncbi:hypothetical protein R1CP_20570 [Rhodococcus opacus]|uniref:DUF1269 domain-containing family protein n=1 Tax=Rhodococcus opacus TaxID=37919 RepID=A0A1B1K841_RHOOP|nr:hypothetical protein R1CP_20570 [Rhodococcus opacus]